MKEIKAYIRTSRLNVTVEELEKAGVPGITVVTVHPVGYGFEPNYFTPEYEGPIKDYEAITKLEIVCSDADVDNFVNLIVRHACTGIQGDGMIFVAPIEKAMRIRTGEQNEDEACHRQGASPAGCRNSVAVTHDETLALAHGQ